MMNFFAMGWTLCCKGCLSVAVCLGCLSATVLLWLYIWDCLFLSVKDEFACNGLALVSSKGCVSVAELDSVTTQHCRYSLTQQYDNLFAMGWI